MKPPCLHPLPLRIWHWTNAFIVAALIATGLYLRLQGIAALKPHDPVLTWHRYAGYAMIAAIAFWLIYTLTSKGMRSQYGIRKKDFLNIFPQIRFYLFSIFTGAENPFKADLANKYNPLQKMAYGALMFFFLPVQALTGLLFMDIPVVRPYLLSESLIGPLDAIHVMLTYLLILYVIVHLYMATLGTTFLSHTKAMITGYEDEGVRAHHEDPPVPVEASLERTTE
jgi:thiosulfate reductase cytochrome b subunit